MDSAGATLNNNRDPFMPRQPRVRGRAIALAVLAHLLLVVGLWFAVDWRSEEPATVAAELWSSTPQAAAPRAAEPPPPPPQVEKAVAPPPKPTPKPPEPVVVKPPTPTLPDPQIAIEKAKREQARRVAAEEAKAEAKREAEAAAREQAERDQQVQAQKQKEADRLKAEKAQKAAAEAKADQVRQDQARNDKAKKDEAARLQALREAQLQRMTGMMGATGAPTDTGNAQHSSAPSANWAGRVVARVKPNIVLTDPVDGNPRAVVEVRLAPDGTIIGKRLVQSSGSKPWDDAVLRAIERTGMLPLDNGHVPSVFEIGFRPRD